MAYILLLFLILLLMYSQIKKYLFYDDIEKVRNDLLNDNSIIEVEDFGAGSAVISSNKRVVKTIARSSLKNKKFGQLFFRIVNYYRPETIIELGTSLGITTAYLASANHFPTVYSLEGAKNIISIAQSTFHHLGIKNIELVKEISMKHCQAFFPQLRKLILRLLMEIIVKNQPFNILICC